MPFILGINFGIAAAALLVLVLQQSQREEARWLAYAALLVVFTSVGLLLSADGADIPSTVRVFLGGPAFTALSAILLIYVRAATGKLSPLDTLWFVPATVHFALLFVGGEQQGYHLYVGGFVWLNPETGPVSWAMFMPILFGIVYPLLALFMARKFLAQSKDWFAAVEQFDFRAMAYLQIGMAFVAVAALLIAWFFGEDLYWALSLMMGAFGAFLLAVIVYASLHGRNRPVHPLPPKGQQPSPLLDHETVVAQSLNPLDKAMDEGSAYLSDQYSLSALAEAAGLAPEQVTEILRSNGTNFYDYVNERRVQQAQNLLANPAQAETPILALAHEAGFQSKATFNRVFKKITGQTPTAYRRQALIPA